MTNILVAVEDSAAGLAAAQVAVRVAADMSARLRAVHVLGDGDVERALRGGAPDAVALHARQEAGAGAVLHHVAALAAAADVPVETVVLRGRPASCILAQARDWPADVIVIGRVGGAKVGQPYVGSEVHHVLEFAEVPVLVVPPPVSRR